MAATKEPFPAGAGMNRRGVASKGSRGTVPRRRGDEPAKVGDDYDPPNRSPQARG